MDSYETKYKILITYAQVSNYKIKTGEFRIFLTPNIGKGVFLSKKERWII